MRKVGEFLKNFRLKKGITEQDILEKTSLTIHVINLIEKGDFEKIGARIYIKNFLTQYCGVIGLTQFETEEIVKKVIDTYLNNDKSEIFSEKKDFKISYVVFFLVFLFIILFAFNFLRVHNEKERFDTGNRSTLDFKQKNRLKRDVFSKKVSPENSPMSDQSAGEKDKSENMKDDDSSPLNVKGETINSSGGFVSTKIEQNKNDTKEKLKNYNAFRVKVRFVAKCMCWIKASYNGSVLKDFILKKGEDFSFYLPEGTTLTIGNAKCVEIFFNGNVVNLPDTKVIKKLVVNNGVERENKE